MNLALRTVACLAAALLLACALRAQIPLPSTIDDASFGPLETGKTYIANGDVFVTARQTLTIQPGAVVKFTNPRDEFEVRNGASLVAVGTATAPIVFTSIHDDSVGARTGSRAPAPGDWDDLTVDGATATMQFVEVRYAGWNDNPSLILANTPATTVRNCTVRDGLEDGIRARGIVAIEDCTILNCEDAIDSVSIQNLPNLRNNVARGPGSNALRVTEISSITTSFSIGPENGVNGEVLVLGNVLTRTVNGDLTLRAGLILKLFGQLRAENGARLRSLGTKDKPVIVTSRNDDSVGNDSLGDGPTTGAPGDWTGVLLRSAREMELAYTEIRFGGSGFGDPAGLAASAGVLKMTGCVVDSAQFDGINVAGSLATLVDNDVRNCGRRAIVGASLPNIADWSGNTASGCAGGSSLFTFAGATGTPQLGTTTRLGPQNGIRGEIVVTEIRILAPDVSLTLDAGMIVKLSRSVVTNGTARVIAKGTSAAPVIFTSFADDSVGNDALGDGPTTGKPGDWGVVDIRGVGSRFDGTEFRFGGASFSGNAMVILQGNGTAVFRDCVFEFSSKGGLDLLGPRPAGVTWIERCAFRNNATRPITNLDWAEVPLLRDCSASGNGLIDELYVQTQSVTTPVAVHVRNTMQGSGVVESLVGMRVTTGGDVLFGPGVKVKMRSGNLLAAAGRMSFDGRGDKLVRVTSYLDDSVGGDTNKDGSATQPAPGDWGQIAYDDRASVEGYVAHVHASYGGRASAATACFRCDCERVRVTSARADFSQSSGFEIRKLRGPGANWIAYKCGREGVRLLGSAEVVQHATVTENAGVGIFGGAGYLGTVVSSISWNNGRRVPQDNFVTVRHTKCNGSTVSGNINADPLFVDVQNGDLHIAPTSLCVGRGDLPQATLWGVDFDGNSRILDHALNGLALPDIGAFEVFQYRMGIDSELRIGKTTTFTIGGPGPKLGFQVVFVGPAIGGQFLPPFGVLIAGTLANTMILTVQPTGQSLALPVPDDTMLVGTRVGLQTLIITDLSRPAGGLANALLATITD